MRLPRLRDGGAYWIVETGTGEYRLPKHLVAQTPDGSLASVRTGYIFKPTPWGLETLPPRRPKARAR